MRYLSRREPRSLGSSELSGSMHAFGGRNLGPRVTPGLGVSPDRTLPALAAANAGASHAPSLFVCCEPSPLRHARLDGVGDGLAHGPWVGRRTCRALADCDLGVGTAVPPEMTETAYNVLMSAFAFGPSKRGIAHRDTCPCGAAARRWQRFESTRRPPSPKGRRGVESRLPNGGTVEIPTTSGVRAQRVNFLLRG